jgi:glycosyltransferase involved in cell wall biosynthesis
VSPDQVSVAVCVRNGAAYLEEALASAFAERPLEVVVADDGSADDSAAIAEAAGARLLRLAPVGPTAARNAALAATSGAAVSCLDADDRWPAGRLSTLCRALDGADAAYGRQRTFGDGVTPQVLAGRHVGTLLLRREALDRIGPLDESLTAGAVVDWVARTDVLALVEVPDVVLERRVHATNFSHTAAEAVRRDYVRAARAALLRRREG